MKYVIYREYINKKTKDKFKMYWASPNPDFRFGGGGWVSFGPSKFESIEAAEKDIEYFRLNNREPKCKIMEIKE